ncbi:ATP-dependent zinc metalloprotease FTSH 12, chloroplastic-like isoform X2 [Vigna umbellata]|uniref:ATP-dependent zinc metalloprotease FTSH 12, chloroplastic-like isoform X1 n=1 Tax=Vigna umbellata TaxID=87088 RepID=UPI001F5F6E8F|nr:ATP-dependent zinc metalloprotease FTSH 12, chloroplastic-like isoform X1 [Vigna umbellata]XP_047165737.1 ATP-dependent zinc metalloprotease FTSH 12, chloroplastic-like isoform X2 [Vigna umbellata]
MELSITHTPNPLHCFSSPQLFPNPNVFTLSAPRPRRKLRFRVSATAEPDGASWSQSLRRGSQRFWINFGEMVKKETGLDFQSSSVKNVGEVMSGDELRRFGTQWVSRFVDWNRWERWKKIKDWEPLRIGTFVLYIFVVTFACRGVYVAVQTPFINRQKKELAEAYMEVLIPEPSPTNIRR